MPNVQGLSAKAALTKLTKDGLDPVRKSVKGSAKTEGTVVSQVPASPGQVAKGQKVTIYVALPPANTPIPPVTGLTLVIVEADLRAAGFKWTIKWQAPVAAGEVQNQVVDEVPAPPAGAPAGTVVTLGVIKGNYSIAVPPVVGMTQAQADAAINTAGLLPGTATTEYSNPVASGLVIRSNPPAGQKVAANSAVNLVISSGSLIGIPYVIGETLEQAQTDIKNAGLTSVIVPMTVSSPSEVGLIVKEQPGGGQLVKPGRLVTLYVAGRTRPRRRPPRPRRPPRRTCHRPRRRLGPSRARNEAGHSGSVTVSRQGPAVSILGLRGNQSEGSGTGTRTDDTQGSRGHRPLHPADPAAGQAEPEMVPLAAARPARPGRPRHRAELHRRPAPQPGELVHAGCHPRHHGGRPDVDPLPLTASQPCNSPQGCPPQWTTDDVAVGGPTGRVPVDRSSASNPPIERFSGRP